MVEAAAREGWGGLVEALEERGWLLCKVLFVTLDDCCCCPSFKTSRDSGKPTFELWTWVIWLAS